MYGYRCRGLLELDESQLQSEVFQRRVNAFLFRRVAGERVRIMLGGRLIDVGSSDRVGHFQHVIDLEEAVFLTALVALMRAEYEKLKEPTPEWLDARGKALAREINSRRRDQLELRLRQAKSARSRLMTADERRAQTDREIAELEAALLQ